MNGKILILIISAIISVSLVSKSTSWKYERLECQGAYNEYCFNGPNSTDDYRVFDDAITWCQNRLSQLVVISDSENQDTASSFLNSWSSSSTDPVYINMKLNMARIRHWYLINGSQFNGGIVDQGQEEYKLYIALQFASTPPPGSWGLGSKSPDWWTFASRPDVPRRYICEFNGSFCSVMSNSFVYNGRCFVKYENDSVNWFEARKQCISDGGDLASFNVPSTESYQPPFNTSMLNRTLSYWVGIRYINLSWMSPSDAQNESMFYNWSSGKPNDFSYSCVCLNSSAVPRWSWTDCNCSVPRPFLCLTRIQTTTVKTATATTIAGPAITTQPMVICNDRLGIGIGIGVGITLFVVIVVIIIAVCILKQGQKRASDASVTIRGNESQPSAVTSGDHRLTLQPPSPADYEGFKSEQSGTEAHAYDRLNQMGRQEYEEIAGATRR